VRQVGSPYSGTRIQVYLRKRNEKVVKHKLIEEHYRQNFEKLIKRTTWRVPNRSQALAEECVQEAYTRAMKYWKTFNPKQDIFNKWFEGILRNAVNDCRTQEADRGISIETTPEGEIPLLPDRKERIMALHIIRMLEPGPKRSILTLFLLFGYTTKDIAEYTGIKEGTVRQIIARWRNKQ
jgi:RNA polymerase sigma factor (sigma-70 family)